MNEEDVAKRIFSDYTTLVKFPPKKGNSNFMRSLEKNMDDEFQKAIPTETNVFIKTPAGTLNFGDNYGKQSYISDIANGVYNYWKQTIEPSGSPVSCASISEVTNDAEIVIPIIISGLTNMANPNKVSNPPYLEFCKVITNAVREIKWTVVEDCIVKDTTFTVHVT